MGDPAAERHVQGARSTGSSRSGSWTKIEGLGFEFEVKTYREGGVNGYMHKIIGPCKYANVRLTPAGRLRTRAR